MMEQRQNIYPANLSDLLSVSYQQNARLSPDGDEKFEFENRFETNERFVESPVSMDDGDSSQYGVDLTGKTNFSGKSFTIAAILGLTNEDDVMNLSVQERLQGQRQFQNYLYNGHEVQRINEGIRSMVQQGAMRQGQQFRSCTRISKSALRSLVGNGDPVESPEEDPRTGSKLLDYSQRKYNPREIRPPLGQMKTSRSHAICSNSSTRSKRIRTIFTPEQLERLEAEFERQQYMVGPERLYLAHALHLTEAQVKVWFQNRRIKWRKHHLEVTQQRLAVLQRHHDSHDDV